MNEPLFGLGVEVEILKDQIYEIDIQLDQCVDFHVLRFLYQNIFQKL